jgi:hypothetical protein
MTLLGLTGMTAGTVAAVPALSGMAEATVRIRLHGANIDHTVDQALSILANNLVMASAVVGAGALRSRCRTLGRSACDLVAVTMFVRSFLLAGLALGVPTAARCCRTSRTCRSGGRRLESPRVPGGWRYNGRSPAATRGSNPARRPSLLARTSQASRDDARHPRYHRHLLEESGVTEWTRPPCSRHAARGRWSSCRSWPHRGQAWPPPPTTRACSCQSEWLRCHQRRRV